MRCGEIVECKRAGYDKIQNQGSKRGVTASSLFPSKLSKQAPLAEGSSQLAVVCPFVWPARGRLLISGALAPVVAWR